MTRRVIIGEALNGHAMDVYEQKSVVVIVVIIQEQQQKSMRLKDNEKNGDKVRHVV